MRLNTISFILWIFIHTEVLIAQQPVRISELRLVDNYHIKDNLQFEKTHVGGLSGIDYDESKELFYLISDDRSSKNPARFYTSRFHLSDKGKIDSIIFLSVHTLLQENGEPYPPARINPSLTPDPESIRFNPETGELIWTSEGEKSNLQNPFLNVINAEGKFVSSFTLPDNLSMKREEKGPRSNGSMEGVTFNDDYSRVYASMEEPLYEDGPRSQAEETYSWVRITEFDITGKNAVAQYAYRLEPLAHKPFPTGAFAINGITEILYAGSGQLLVVERSYSTGRLACTVKVFLGDLKEAENILDVSSLTEQPPHKPVQKKLLLNMDDLGIFIDNIEGVTFGPMLSNGNRTLIFVADNNFQSLQKNQFLVFEIMP